jgi:hypothetical protein
LAESLLSPGRACQTGTEGWPRRRDPRRRAGAVARQRAAGRRTGTTHFTVTDTPSHVSLVDENGNIYSLTGAIWFGGRNYEILPTTHMLNIVGRGGVSDSIRLVERSGTAS